MTHEIYMNIEIMQKFIMKIQAINLEIESLNSITHPLEGRLISLLLEQIDNLGLTESPANDYLYSTIDRIREVCLTINTETTALQKDIDLLIKDGEQKLKILSMESRRR